MFVVGCHRSGTSLLASIISDYLNEQGISESKKNIPAQVDNPGGFFESQQLVSFNEELLGQLGIDWQYPPLHAIQWQCSEFLPRLHAARKTFSKQALSKTWVDKDPRLCLTYPAFHHILLKRTPIAAVIRHPFEVASSLQNRDMIPIAKGLIIWFLYNQHLSRSLNDQDLLISYQSLINREDSAIAALSAFISSNTPEYNQTNISIKSILSRRTRPEWKRNDESVLQNLLPEIEWTEIAEICTEIYKKISESKLKIQQLKSCFAYTPDEILRGCSVLGWQTLKPNNVDDTLALEAARIELDKIKNSNSWRLTAPLRWLGDKVKRKTQQNL